MRFHFLLTNHYPYGCYRIEDVVVPVAAGLAALGHKVTYGFDDDVAPWPAVNLLVENFNDPAVVDQVVALRRSGPRRYCFGLICPEDFDDPTVMAHIDFPDRKPNLIRLLPEVDFVWTLVPCSYDGHVDASRVRLLEYGYLAAQRRDSALPRDLDVLFYGDLGPRRILMFNALVQRGLSVSATFGLLPDYFKSDLLDRAKIVVDARRSDAVRFLCPTRLAVPLHRGLLIISEAFDRGPLSRLYKYTLEVTADTLVETCVQAARSGKAQQAGQSARDMFARDTSMTGNLTRAMDIPVFRELAAG